MKGISLIDQGKTTLRDIHLPITQHPGINPTWNSQTTLVPDRTSTNNAGGVYHSLAAGVVQTNEYKSDLPASGLLHMTATTAFNPLATLETQSAGSNNLEIR